MKIDSKELMSRSVNLSTINFANAYTEQNSTSAAIFFHFIFILFFISNYKSTAGGDLSMLSPLHAGFGSTLPHWLSAGWKGYYII